MQVLPGKGAIQMFQIIIIISFAILLCFSPGLKTTQHLEDFCCHKLALLKKRRQQSHVLSGNDKYVALDKRVLMYSCEIFHSCICFVGAHIHCIQK